MFSLSGHEQDVVPSRGVKIKKYKMSEIILKRIYAYLIDMVVISVPSYIFLFVFWSKFIETQPQNLLSFEICTQFIPFFIYFFFSEMLFSKTLGKHIMKLKVVINKGNKFINVFIRTICRFIPLDLISFLVMKDKILHDHLSNTQVVFCQ